MYKIPNVIPYKSDELQYSWIIRLSNANGIDDVRRFASTYLWPNEFQERLPRSDFREQFELFWRALPHDVISERELFLGITTFAGHAPFMTKEHRQRYISQAFNTDRKFEELFPLPHSIVKPFRICPDGLISIELLKHFMTGVLLTNYSKKCETAMNNKNHNNQLSL